MAPHTAHGGRGGGWGGWGSASQFGRVWPWIMRSWSVLGQWLSSWPVAVFSDLNDLCQCLASGYHRSTRLLL